MIAKLEEAWIGHGLSITPKAHLLFKRLIALLRKYGGLGDKVEKWIEEMHQQQKRQHHLVCRMSSGFEAQATTTHKNLWRNAHPLVLQEIEKVKEFSRRKNLTTPNTSTIEDERNKILIERAEKVLDTQTQLKLGL